MNVEELKKIIRDAIDEFERQTGIKIESVNYDASGKVKELGYSFGQPKPTTLTIITKKK